MFATPVAMPQVAAPLAPAYAAADRAALHRTPLNQLVERYMMPQLDHFFDLLDASGKDLVIDNTRVFTGKDRFLTGKIAMGLSYLLAGSDRNSAKFQTYLAGFQRMAELTLNDPNDTWGIYYYLAGVNRLREAGLLEAALSPALLAHLRERLDWRVFVDVNNDYRLIGLPTNYYGVAFSIARLRYLMGWEDAVGSEILIEKTVKHYQEYSGEFGFSDETDGDGRFDRYSVLLIAEICGRFVETGLTVTPQLKAWLRKAVDVVLVRLNEHGDGFDFGRSIGSYGDTAFLEILTTAAYLDVLTPEERDIAYAFQVRSIAKYLTFWFDAGMQSLNLWDKGRRTDAYRAKHRVLGENFTMLHHHIYTANLWNRMGYRDTVATAPLTTWLARQPRFSVTWFARGKYDRALIGFRDGAHVIDLPLINGGPALHQTNPYYPVPFSNRLAQGAADSDFPQLLPRFTLADGSVLTGLAYFRNIAVKEEGSVLRVSYEMKEMNRLGDIAPVKDGRLQAHTEYVLDSGVITRVDTYTPTEPLEGVSIVMEFGSFSEGAVVEGNTVRFAKGDVFEFEATGFATCSVVSVAEHEEYRAPIGQMKTRLRYEASNVRLDKPITLTWKMKYRN